jgi:uncharacterized membrane protein
MKNLNKILRIALAVVIVAALGCLVYVIAAPKQGEKFTEFYILNTEGEAGNYPGQVLLSEPAELIVGIINHEQEPTGYRVEIKIDGILNKEITVAALAHEEKWEEVVSFTPQILGERQQVEFWLYRSDESNPYFEDPLSLYIDTFQFYVLNAEGIAGDYRSKVALGEPVDLIVGIVNDKSSPTSYRVDISIDGALNKTITTQPLARWERWEEPISFIPKKIGEGQEIEFQFYKEGELGYALEETLYLDINVTALAFLPERGNRYTEFYILNAEGGAADYPSQVVLGEPVELILGIVSHEYELTSYQVKIKVDGILYEVIETEPLSHWEKWEEAISFTPRLLGERQEVEFWLYKVDESEPYYEVPIHFYIDVTETG